MSTLVGAVFDDCSTLDAEDQARALAGIGAGTSYDNVFGTSGKLVGTNTSDLYEVNGEFTIKDHGGDDDLICAEGTDVDMGSKVEHAILTGSDDLDVDGNSKNNVIAGNLGNNEIDGKSGHDTLLGGGGNDTIDGGSGHDLISGGTGDDEIISGSGHDTVFGGTGNDTIDSGSGNDAIEGGDGNDVIDGGSGRDTIEGGAGDDTMTGGSGTDIFNFDDASGADVITDFHAGSDKIGIASGINGSSITDSDDVMGHVSANVFGDAVIDLGGGNSITLEGVDVDDLDASDFFV